MNTVQFNDNNLAMNAGIVRVYCVDSLTHEYVGYIDEMLSVGVGIPANSYLDEPPMSKEGFSICRIGDKWQYIEDLRGQVAYNKATQESVTIDSLGALSDVLTFKVPSSVFDVWSGEKWITDTDKQKAAIVETNQAQKDALLSQAEQEILRLERAVRLEMITNEEKERLTKLERFTILISRVDINDVNLIFPDYP